MRIASLNIWNLQGSETRRQKYLPDHISKIDSDVILLQEVSIDKSFLPQSVSIASKCGYEYQLYFKAGEWKGREEGLAILSKFPIQSQYSRQLSTGIDNMGRIVCGAQIKLEDNSSLYVFNTHLAYPVDAEDDRVKQVIDICEFLNQIDFDNDDKIILGGDFNDEPNSKVIQNLSKFRWKLVDAHGESCNEPTFSSKNPYADERLVVDRKIDHLFLRENINIKNAKIYDEKTLTEHFSSDHYAISVDI